MLVGKEVCGSGILRYHLADNQKLDNKVKSRSEILINT